MGGARLSKSLIQLSANGQGCVPFLLFDLRGLLWGHCSFLLGPSAHKVLFVPSKNLFPQSCVSSGGSMVGLMTTSSKRAYTIPRSTAPRALAPAKFTADLGHIKEDESHLYPPVQVCTHAGE